MMRFISNQTGQFWVSSFVLYRGYNRCTKRIATVDDKAIKHQSFSITSMLNIYRYCYVTIVEAGLHEFNDEKKWMFIVI